MLFFNISSNDDHQLTGPDDFLLSDGSLNGVL